MGTIQALTMILREWRTYYALDDRKEIFERIVIHIRRHLRKLIWRAWKRPKTRERELRRRGLPSEQAWKSSVNGHGSWWNANAPHMLKAFPNSVFRRMGLYGLLSKT
ncbi:group II intron maturase-specific domain-containing protein [Sutterella wadsworthensis]|uniref:group II intron maturase-specific domain-containing protein n=1 Tax=Sutterella wadsworthensis TaxID=40545 RepID=UPI003A94B727